MEVLEGCGDLVLAFLVENNLGGSCVVVDFKHSPHSLLTLANRSSHQNDLFVIIAFGMIYIIDGLSVNLAHVIWPRTGVLHHLQSDRDEHSGFALLVIVRFFVAVVILVALTMREKSVIV